EGALDLRRTHPLATDLEHVVGSPRVPVVAVLVDGVLVAGPQPMAFEGVLRLLVLVPVAGAGRVAADPQVPDFAAWYRDGGVIEDARVVATDDLAAGPGTNRAGSVRDEHVQRLGRSDPVDDVDTVALFEAIVQSCRQRLTG